MASDPLLIDVIVLDESRQSRSLLENGVYGPFLICGESDNDGKNARRDLNYESLLTKASH